MEKNIQKLNQLGLLENNRPTLLYREVYQLYYSMLLQFLNQSLGLTHVEQVLLDATVKPLNQSEKDIYQRMSFLKFFYIRNNLRVECLPEDLLQTLIDRVQTQNNSYDSVMKRLIETTYSDVITDIHSPLGANICYGNLNSLDYFAPNNAVVLGFRNDPDYESDHRDGKWLPMYLQRNSLAKKSQEQVMKLAEEKLSVPLRVISYNEYSKVRDKNSIDDILMPYR